MKLKVGIALVVVLLFGAFFGAGIAQVVSTGWFLSLSCATDPRLANPVTSRSFCVEMAVPPKIRYWDGTAWAQMGYEDTTGTAVILDSLNEIASVAVAGQRTAVARIPASVSLSGTLKPVISADNGATFIETDHAGAAAAVFVDGAGARTTSLVFPIGVPTNPVTLKIETWLPATHIGVKVTAYTSGSASTTVRAMAFDANRSVATTTVSGGVELKTPAGDSAMDETFNAAKVTVENVITAGGQSAAAGVTAYPSCTGQAFLNMTTATTTELVPLTASELIRLCHVHFIANGTTTVKFVNGTGSNCASTQHDVSPLYNLTAQVGLSAGNGAGTVMDNTQAGGAGGVGEALCVTNSQAVNVQVFVRYAKY